MLAKSQTRTRTSASPSLILESLQAPIPYNLQDNQTRRARPHRRSDSSARSFPGCSAQLLTHRLASATGHGAQILTIPRSPPLAQQQVLQGKPAAVGQGHWDTHKPPHCTPKLALDSCHQTQSGSAGAAQRQRPPTSACQQPCADFCTLLSSELP